MVVGLDIRWNVRLPHQSVLCVWWRWRTVRFQKLSVVSIQYKPVMHKHTYQRIFGERLLGWVLVSGETSLELTDLVVLRHLRASPGPDASLLLRSNSHDRSCWMSAPVPSASNSNHGMMYEEDGKSGEECQ